MISRSVNPCCFLFIIASAEGGTSRRAWLH
jgi:hypothetical protein